MRRERVPKKKKERKRNIDGGNGKDNVTMMESS